MKTFKTLLFLVLLPFLVRSQFADIVSKETSKTLLSTYQVPPFLLDSNDTWVKKTMEKMTEEERIAQLFMVAAYSNKDAAHENEIAELVKKYKIGGLIFFQGGPVRQARLTNKYQSMAQVPLMIAIDGEWGLNMRLDSTIGYPRQMALGAIQDDKYVYEMGKSIADRKSVV